MLEKFEKFKIEKKKKKKNIIFGGSSSGQPGGGLSFLIRGQSSIGNNTSLHAQKTKIVY